MKLAVCALALVLVPFTALGVAGGDGDGAAGEPKVRTFKLQGIVVTYTTPDVPPSIAYDCHGKGKDCVLKSDGTFTIKLG